MDALIDIHCLSASEWWYNVHPEQTRAVLHLHGALPQRAWERGEAETTEFVVMDSMVTSSLRPWIVWEHGVWGPWIAWEHGVWGP